MNRYQNPERVSVRDALNGNMDELEVSAASIQSNLFLMLYSREATRLIPLFIEQLYQENYQVITGLTGGDAGINIGMHYSVICSEDLPLIADADLTAARADAEVLVYDMLVLPRIEGCKVWPSRELAADFFEPVVSEKPVLIFSASQDPVTPRRWGDKVAATLGNSRHVVAEGIGHGVFAYGCAVELIAELVATADPQSLDTACIDNLAVRPFFISSGGSTRADD
jgi:pimeloyl-ACP methyl ester carboxylesterase